MGILKWVLLNFSIFSIFSLPCHSLFSNEVWALTAFKEAIYEDPYLVLSDWHGLDPTPCIWSGVSCSMTLDHVLKLNITGKSLKGFLAPELGQLANLQYLVLHGNNFIGRIPKEIGLLKNLRVLDLGGNKLTGSIPRELGSLENVVKINLQSNGLTGRLPTELSELQFLQELQLDRNKLRGVVLGRGTAEFVTNVRGMYTSNGNLTGFCRLSQLKVADFSYNFFVGNIPKCLQYLPRSSFQGNCLQEYDVKQRPIRLCGMALVSKNQSSSLVGSKHNRKSPKKSKPGWLLALEIVTGTIAGLLVLTALLAVFKRFNSKASVIIPWKKSGSDKGKMAVYLDSEMLKDVRRFSKHELEVACEDFSNVIGSSSESMIYKGTMKGGPEIAVISLRIKEEQWSEYHELYFQREVADLARLNHENIGKLLGYCQENSPFTRMLVFEYACNGTLHDHLHYGECSQLFWTRRMKIIVGIARGLRYLHTELNLPFTISELNSTAVYLTEDFSPKVVDFESCKTIVGSTKRDTCVLDSNGAICILPGPISQRHLDIKGNVYSFGVLLLEIISGKPPFNKDTGTTLVDWAKGYLEMPEMMVDPNLKHYKYDEFKAVSEVASLCLVPDPIRRPSMDEVCATLEGCLDLNVSLEFKSPYLAWVELALTT